MKKKIIVGVIIAITVLLAVGLYMQSQLIEATTSPSYDVASVGLGSGSSLLGRVSSLSKSTSQESMYSDTVSVTPATTQTTNRLIIISVMERIKIHSKMRNEIEKWLVLLQEKLL